MRHTDHATAGRSGRDLHRHLEVALCSHQGCAISQAIIEAQEYTSQSGDEGCVRQGPLAPPVPAQSWGHSRSSWPWLEDSTVPWLVPTHHSSKPFFLQHATLKGKNVITPTSYSAVYPSAPEASPESSFECFPIPVPPLPTGIS